MQPDRLDAYQTTKTVEAAKVEGYGYMEPGPRGEEKDPYLILRTKAGQVKHPVRQQWLNHHRPQVGWWLIRYPDGYESVCPADAFEPYALDLSTGNMLRSRMEPEPSPTEALAEEFTDARRQKRHLYLQMALDSPWPPGIVEVTNTGQITDAIIARAKAFAEFVDGVEVRVEGENGQLG